MHLSGLSPGPNLESWSVFYNVFIDICTLDFEIGEYCMKAKNCMRHFKSFFDRLLRYSIFVPMTRVMLFPLFPAVRYISRIVCGRPGYVPKSISHRKPLVLHRPLGHYLIVLREKQHWDISCIYQHLSFLNSRTNLFQLFENEGSHYTVADHKREKTNVGEEKRRKGAS